ncbi:hypothetical protein CORC01_08639 [Colletotrichum orchidophilum]|uniref:Uncharacterized protein n=1 Tax=Colletotrichum orchidophilum TaxID=1209926 RepID=A0A1G4B4A2_9PEZI|nr:uncharacterized protein CORC01_08639 [Colletotrichum orchidophilum]OHE96102.1 hypothetical protein CORC01_08639 [Colletotrichum orchidophilum]
MRSPSSLLALASLLRLVSAAVITGLDASPESRSVLWEDLAVNPELSERQPGGVFITTDIGWGGTTGYAKQPYDLCIVLTSPWYHTISSIGPDAGNAIVVSEDNSCAGNSYTIFNPGSNQGWNDRIGSFRVRQIPGDQCIGEVNYQRLPGVDCGRCCNGCNRSGTDCCPAGVFC